MDFKSSQVSFLSLGQRAVLCSHETLSSSPVINGIASRIASLLLSPAAALDFAVHTAALPATMLYAVGKSIVLWKPDFSIPWQHLQRIREAVFPILLGTIAGVIHPYAGIYMTEPRDKHIAGGILLSNSKVHSDICVSPISAFEEVKDILRDTAKEDGFPTEYSKHVASIASWERPLEMVQAVEMFDFKLTANGMSALYKVVDQTRISDYQKEVLKRVSLIAYPILATLDIATAVTSSLLLFGIGVVQLLGAKSPCYLETTSSPVLHVYNVARVIVGIFSAFVGFGISLFNPEKGLAFSFPSSRKLHTLKALTFPIFKRLEREVDSLANRERLILPIVLQNGGEKDILPSRNSHMTYLIIERRGETFTAEYVDRSEKHGIIRDLTKEQVCKIGKNCLKLRFISLNQGMNSYISDTFNDKNDLAELGNQGNLTNCVITNLFAVFDVLNHRSGGSSLDHQHKIKSFRQLSQNRYDHYQYDFFPFAPMEEIVNEILALNSEKI